MWRRKWKWLSTRMSKRQNVGFPLVLLKIPYTLFFPKVTEQLFNFRAEYDLIKSLELGSSVANACVVSNRKVLFR